MRHPAILLFTVFLSLIPTLAVAQQQLPTRMPLTHSRGFANSIVRDLPSGDRAIAFSGQTSFDLDGRTIDRGAVLMRVSPTGAIRWVRELGHDDAIIRHVIPLTDGTMLVAGVLERGFIALMSGNGDDIWSLSPVGEYNFFQPAVTQDGAIIVLGDFTRGTISLPGVADMTSRRQFNHYLAELDPASGHARWARMIDAGIEEDHLAIDTDGSILLATHDRGSAGESDTVINRYTRTGEYVGVVYRRDRPEQNFPHGLRVMADGSYLLLSALWRTQGGGYESRLIGLERDGTVRFERDVPHWSELVGSTDRTFVEVFAPVTRTNRQRGMDQYVPGVQIQAFDLNGGPISERTLMATGPDWDESTICADRTVAGVWLSGYATDGSTHNERFLFVE